MQHQTNAMAEIALALAMGFFSIMVLTMVSMGAGVGQSPVVDDIGAERIPVSPSISAAGAAKKTSAAMKKFEGILLIHYQGRFLDPELQPVNLTTMTVDSAVAVAVDPQLSMVKTMEIRRQVPLENVTVTTLDQHWILQLKEKFDEH